MFKEVKAAWSGDLIMEEAMKGDSDTNGPAEVAVKVVEGLTRTYKLALERRCSCVVRDTMAVMAWIVAWAALMHRRYMLGTDGLSAYQRLKGKRPGRPIVEIGERERERERECSISLSSQPESPWQIRNRGSTQE